MSSTSLAVVSQYLVDLIQANRTTIGLPTTTGVVNVFYGDQDTFTTTPMVCVEPDNKKRTLDRARRMTTIDFSIGILVYHSVITDPQANRKQADIMAEAIETLIHANPAFGFPYGTSTSPLVTHSFVEQIESGYVRKAGSTVRSSRLYVTAQNSRDILPPNP